MIHYLTPSSIQDINKVAKSGDTVFLKEGKYIGYFNFTCNEVTVLAEPGSDVVFDRPKESPIGQSAIITIRGEYNKFIGFEVKNSTGTRQSGKIGSNPSDINAIDGIGLFGKGNKLINLIIHDNVANNIGSWKTAYDTEIYGCVLYYAGWDAPDRGHGYNIYTQNLPENRSKNIENCFIFGSHRIGINAYGSVEISGYKILGNTVFDNGKLSKHNTRINMLAGSKRTVSNIEASRNTFYHSRGGSMVQFGYTGKNKDVKIQDNHFINDNLFIRDWQDVEVIGNTFIDDNPIKFHLMEMPNPDKIRMKYNTYFSDGGTIKMDGMARLNGKSLLDRKSYHLPRGQAKNSVEITPNKYDPSRIHITVRNPEGLATVAVDMSQYLEPGTEYEILDVQNYFGGPVRAGVYKGGDIGLPMTLTEVSEPIGNVSVQPKHTGIELGTFILKTKQI